MPQECIGKYGENKVMQRHNRVAVITGGGKGIGAAITLRLARDGAAVVVAGRAEADLKAVCQEVQALGGAALAVPTDVSHEDQVRTLMDRARQTFGPVNVLVNNAGITGPTAPVVELERRDWDEVLAINLTGALLCCRAALPGMIEHRAGKIVNISSVAGKVAYALRSAYAVSKWGLIGLTLTLAKEVGVHNIQVNAVCPGPVAGERLQRVIAHRARELGQTAAEVERAYVEATALKRLVPPEEVAALVAFLASAEADNITGQAIDVSAGHGL
jgi:NAD(P)-dependent dehydrogenase (short-subunit alcohol dehydrogenase family)